MKNKTFRAIVLLTILVTLLSGCYWNTAVPEDGVALKITSGKLEKVLGPGRYSDPFGMYTTLTTIDCSAKTINWSDPDLVTSDKQPIGLALSVTYARSRAPETVKFMWGQYNSEAKSDEALEEQVRNRIPRVAKAITTKYSLNDMLGIESEVDRTIVTQEMNDILTAELAEVGIVLLDVGIDNITPDQAYMDLLKRKANAVISVEVAQEETRLLEEQKAQEVAQTDIELERARRERLVQEERGQTYAKSPELYELRKLQLLADIFKQGDKVFFLPADGDVSLLFTGEALTSEGSVVPIPGDGR